MHGAQSANLVGFFLQLMPTNAGTLMHALVVTMSHMLMLQSNQMRKAGGSGRVGAAAVRDQAVAINSIQTSRYKVNLHCYTATACHSSVYRHTYILPAEQRHCFKSGMLLDSSNVETRRSAHVAVHMRALHCNVM
jgi:hypothetical protein